MSKINIVIDDVTKMKVDCAVNAANSGLKEGGGVCGAIFAAAGSRELTKACQAIGHCPTGSAVITPGFKLPAKYIIHAVGPRYRDGNSGEPEQLYRCYKKSLELMLENGCSSIAFPLISSGIFGYPKEDAWERALTACVDFVREHKDQNVTINFAVLKESLKQLGETVLSTIVGNFPLEAETELEDTENADVHEGAVGLKVSVCGHELNIPENYQELKPFPDDPQDSCVYGMQNEGTSCFVMLYPIDARKAMPFGKTEQIARGIHAILGEKQGLIEICSDHTAERQEYTYTVVKTLNEPSGVQYNLTLQITYPEHVLHIQGYFDEIGMTGTRDTKVYELARRQGLVQEGSFDGWMQDPYDSEYKKGVQKNLSENSEYDAQFPDHPLSVLHHFVKTITGFATDKAASGEGDDNSKALEEILGAVGVDMKAFEETINEIMPGIAMYVRDVNLNEACAAAYKQPHLFLMERGFTDASARVMGMQTTHRITILSNHMADLSDFEHDTNWGLFVANHHAHFKVLDVYEYQGKTQILLWHLPDDDRWKMFESVSLNLENDLINDCRKRFENKCMQEVVPELASEEWMKRCSQPVGMDENGNLYDVNEVPGDLPKDVREMDYHVTVRVIMQKLTEDNQKNIAWLRTAIERYKVHPMGSEIIKECARKLYEIHPDNAKKELDGIVNKEMNSIGNRLNEIRLLIVQGKPEEAQPLLDALAKEADENPMFREDEISQFFNFREWFEECLYRHMYDPKKELRRADYPFDEIYSLQGSMYIDLQDLDKAREALKKALAWNPVNPQISFEYAETFKIAGDMETFFEESKKIQKFAIHNTDVARFLRNVGFYFTEVGKYQEAMMCYMRSLFYDRDNKNAENEINYLHQKYGIEFNMPDGKACQAFTKKYGFALGADNDLLGMMYAYGKHFLDGKQEDGARYCFLLFYELTEDPEIKKILKSVGVEFSDHENGGDSEAGTADNVESTAGESNGIGSEGRLYLKNSKADAKGAQTADGFIVFAGSRLFGTSTKSCPDAIKALRKKYKRYVNADLILQKDLTFTSASQAASFVLFASANGLTNWTDEKGTTLRELLGK